MRKWAYKTDAAGRPRRFLSHREAAGWAVRRVGTFFLPLLVSPVLWAVFHPDAPSQRLTALPVMFAVACVWLAVVGGVYLDLALSVVVMTDDELGRGGDGDDAP